MKDRYSNSSESTNQIMLQKGVYCWKWSSLNCASCSPNLSPQSSPYSIPLYIPEFRVHLWGWGLGTRLGLTWVWLQQCWAGLVARWWCNARDNESANRIAYIRGPISSEFFSRSIVLNNSRVASVSDYGFSRPQQ